MVIYTLFQYRALAAVTIGSLAIAGASSSTRMIALLSWGIGYRLSLAGVAGLIIAIGITADSFIVYFERVKDELREGRSLQASIDHAWTRARRTILASDAVSFLAAVVLYVLAIGSVRGFAFTLGLTTLVDVLVVILFTHPVLGLAEPHQVLWRGTPVLWPRPASTGQVRDVQGPRAASARRGHQRPGEPETGPSVEPHACRTQGCRSEGRGQVKLGLAQWGNQLHSGERTYAIVPKRRMWLTISAAAMLLCVIILFTKGLNFGVDFTGGTVYQVSDVANPDPQIAEDVVAQYAPERRAAHLGARHERHPRADRRRRHRGVAADRGGARRRRTTCRPRA